MRWQHQAGSFFASFLELLLVTLQMCIPSAATLTLHMDVRPSERKREHKIFRQKSYILPKNCFCKQRLNDTLLFLLVVSFPSVRIDHSHLLVTRSFLGSLLVRCFVSSVFRQPFQLQQTKGIPVIYKLLLGNAQKRVNSN